MTHYDIDYSKLDDKSKQAKAIKDIKEYLGSGKFNEIHSWFVKLHQHKPMTLEQLSFYLMLPGISGYPVEAWLELIKSDATK